VPQIASIVVDVRIILNPHAGLSNNAGPTSEKLLPIVLSMDLQTMDDEQTSMHESTLDLERNPNQHNDDANQKQ
jgi:hypothetical protein